MLNKSDIDIIDRYADLQLSEDESLELERRIDKDRLFKQDVEFYLGVREAVINKIDKEAYTPRESLDNNNVVNKTRVLWFVIGAITMLMLLYAVITSKGQNDTQLYADCERYVLSMSSDVLRATNTMKPQNKTASLDFHLNSVLAYYKSNQLSESLLLINDLKNTFSDFEDQEILDWWHALILFKQGEMEKAKHMLDKISNNPHYNSNRKANEFLN